MQAASEAMEYEEAIKYRDLIENIKKISETQKMSDNIGEDKDIIALAIDGNETVVQVFFLRNGKLIGREHFYMTQIEEPSVDKILTSFVKQFYAGTPFIPREIMLQESIEDMELVEKWEEEGHIFVIRPEVEPVSRTEQNVEKLTEFYDHGYQLMKQRMEEMQAYLEK